jgi:alpha-mannosidase
MSGTKQIHYVLSTHWDREWYRTFQGFRIRLVELLDKVTDGLEEGKMHGPYQTDGQAIILDDYLEIRPERKELVEKLLQQGKLVAGPWYVLPDEFTVSGESLIRNLRFGRDYVRSMGGTPSNAGFMCDMFGHTSQMPQILAGFDILGAFIWRGINLIGHREVLWRGADGTEMPSFRFGKNGYCDYAFHIRRAHDPKWTLSDPEALAEELDQYVEEETSQCATDALLLFDGGDHQEWDLNIYEVFSKWMSWEGQKHNVQHTSLDAFLQDMVNQKERITTVLEGELREPGLYPLDTDQQWVIPGVLSSRVPLKQANQRCQTLLTQWAEPFDAFSHRLTGHQTPPGFFLTAWKWLLQNHPHDSIDGCSIDQVHQDMVYRFDQCRQIAESLTTDSIRYMSASIGGKIGQDELRVTVFNPLARPFHGITELDLQLPPEWPTFNEFFGYEPKPAFLIYDPNGNEVPYQRLAQQGRRNRARALRNKFWQGYVSNDVSVALSLEIPALGYTTLIIRPGKPGIPTRYPGIPGMITSECSMENEYLRVVVNPNGSLTLTDKTSGQIYERGLTFEDIADIGDGWYHGQASNDQVFVSTACSAEVIQVHDGPFTAALRVRLNMPIPEEFLFDSMARSECRVNMTIDSTITLRTGQKYLEITTTVENPAGDHRLRVLFPSGVKTGTYLADSAFDVIERPIALVADNHLYRELEIETRPQQSWTAIHQDGRGLAVISAGLLETAVRDLPERPIALTLFRSTRRTVFTNGETGGQLFGKLGFHYLLMPLNGEPDRTLLSELGQQLNAGLRDVQMVKEDQPYYRIKENLHPVGAFFELVGPAVLSSAREVGNSFEIRLFNPQNSIIPASLDFSRFPENQSLWNRYCFVNLDSQNLSEWKFFDRRIDIEMGPKKILTLRLESI